MTSKTMTDLIQEIDALQLANKKLRQRNRDLTLMAAAMPLKGPKRPNRPKLTEREVRDIRDAYDGGMKQIDLAANYGVNKATISRIVNGVYH